MPVPYPTAFPLTEVRTITEIVKNNELSSRRAELAHNVWHVQGFMQSILLVENPRPVFGDPEENDRAVVALIDAISTNGELETYGQTYDCEDAENVHFALSDVLSSIL